jgi:hypothetical protein
LRVVISSLSHDQIGDEPVGVAGSYDTDELDSVTGANFESFARLP